MKTIEKEFEIWWKREGKWRGYDGMDNNMCAKCKELARVAWLNGAKKQKTRNEKR